MQTFDVTKTFTFSYTHRLHVLGNAHQCSNFHGHNGKISFTIEVEKTDKFGFVTDFGNLKFIKNWINDNWDHAVIVSPSDSSLLKALEILKTKSYLLNYVESSTSENLCIEIYKNLVHRLLELLDTENIKIISITIRFTESETSSASYRRVYVSSIDP